MKDKSNLTNDGGAMLLKKANVGPMFILFAIAHGRKDILPPKISIEEFKDLMEHAETYELRNCVTRKIVENWLPQQHERERPESEANVVWTACIARKVGVTEIYHETIARLALGYSDLSNDEANVLSVWVKIYPEILDDVKEFRRAGISATRGHLLKFLDADSKDKICIHEAASKEHREECNSKIVNSLEQVLKSDGPKFPGLVEGTPNQEGFVDERGQYIGQILKTMYPAIEGHMSCDPVFRI
ncbi:hypothetical protein BDP81DRAFT_397762 [Colletotrichum phormii]|uniref:Uncharacterized protein n=1 Tax=Colletotrichum phormii TaxID=359342 RepID=A0AAI9ZJ70_9PEZI|nr:uncharacterized protein BDP81DRAFT_397762 [Colletotrichum phormii]KAK1625481.1 hypothetical protein BDP81DRAFT_397762 [Colletotrichum phormii]